MSSQLVCQLVKHNNSFMHKGVNGVILSKEPGNLYNVHNYKYSGERDASNMCPIMSMERTYSAQKAWATQWRVSSSIIVLTPSGA